MKSIFITIALVSMLWPTAANAMPAKTPDKAPAKTPEQTIEKGQVLQLKEFSFTFPPGCAPYSHWTEESQTDSGKVPIEHYQTTNKKGESWEVSFVGFPHVFTSARTNLAASRDGVTERFKAQLVSEKYFSVGKDSAVDLELSFKENDKPRAARAWFIIRMPRFVHKVLFASPDPKSLHSEETEKAFESFKINSW